MEQDKIGIGSFFWALPSMGFHSRNNLLTNLTNQRDNEAKKQEDIKARIVSEKEKRQVDGGNEEGGECREKLLERYKMLKMENDALKKEMKQYEKCDPKTVEEVKKQTTVCKTACDRWVDNCYEVESWIKKNN